MKSISLEEVLSLHQRLIDQYGGSPGVRDQGLLESSINSAFQTFAGQDLYPADLDKIVQMAFSLIKNHCFIDGNKWIGVMVLLYLLDLNKIRHDLSVEDVINIGLKVAANEMDQDQLKQKIKDC